MKSASEKEIEVKNIINWIVNKLLKVINLDPFRQKISQFIDVNYDQGMQKAEIQFDMNFVKSEEDISFLNNYVFENMQQHTDAIGESLRGELSRGIINKETVPQLKKRIKDVFKDKKFTNRLKAVLRTESLRARNYGALAGAEQSGLMLKKYLDVIMDDVTSDICKAENRKYGDKEKSIPIEKEFIVKADNKTIRAQSPPFHPNCRTVIRFEKVKQESDV